jgi:hypothetical protein
VTLVLGVDVSLGRGLDVALMDDARVVETWARVGAVGLKDLLVERRPEAVGIDAPPRPGLSLLRDDAERARLLVPPAGSPNTSCRGAASARTRHRATNLGCSRG